MINGVLYAPNGVGLVEAFDPATGETRWAQEPFAPNELHGDSTRGVAYWTDGRDERILVQRGEYLYALNAKTGKVYSDFGDRGRVNLKIGLGPLMTDYRWTGAPLVIHDVVIIGASMTDSPGAKEQPRGDVRAFDVRTGKLRWQFHVIPQAGEFGVETWENDSWKYTGEAPVWALFSADEELGYVYMPVTSPTSDMYGGHRLGNNLFGQSLVCVKADTGERVWHFQLTHHDLWDFDPPAAPILADITVDGRPIKAVVQVTKQAFAYVFDRVTGKPVWPIEERPVPQSTTPGERTSPTQPFPTKPPAFDRQGTTGRQPDRLHARAARGSDRDHEAVRHRSAVHAAVDSRRRARTPRRERSSCRARSAARTGRARRSIRKPDCSTSRRSRRRLSRISYPAIRSRRICATRRAARPWIGGPRGLPLFKPPYGRITAIDLNRGEHRWMVANGDGPRDHPAIKHLNLPPLGNPGRTAPARDQDPAVHRRGLAGHDVERTAAAGRDAGIDFARLWRERVQSAGQGDRRDPVEDGPAGGDHGRANHLHVSGQAIHRRRGGDEQHPAEWVALGLP